MDFRRTDEQGRTGTTSDDDLGSECGRTHNDKTHGGWRGEQPFPGTFVWTSPLGRTYERTARPLLPGWPTPGGASPLDPEAGRPPPPR